MSEEPVKPYHFQPGQSGNPSGRPKGSRTKILAALDAIGEESAEAIVIEMVKKAKDGDAVAAKAILDRVWPARKGSRMQFDLPSIATAEALPDAIASIAQQVADGEISPDEGAAIVGLIEAQRRAIETNVLEARLTALEERLSK